MTHGLGWACAGEAGQQLADAPARGTAPAKAGSPRPVRARHALDGDGGGDGLDGADQGHDHEGGKKPCEGRPEVELDSRPDGRRQPDPRCPEHAVEVVEPERPGRGGARRDPDERRPQGRRSPSVRRAMRPAVTLRVRGRASAARRRALAQGAEDDRSTGPEGSSPAHVSGSKPAERGGRAEIRARGSADEERGRARRPPAAGATETPMKAGGPSSSTRPTGRPDRGSPCRPARRPAVQKLAKTGTSVRRRANHGRGNQAGGDAGSELRAAAEGEATGGISRAEQTPARSVPALIRSARPGEAVSAKGRGLEPHRFRSGSLVASLSSHSLSARLASTHQRERPRRRYSSEIGETRLPQGRTTYRRPLHPTFAARDHVRIPQRRYLRPPGPFIKKNP